MIRQLLTQAEEAFSQQWFRLRRQFGWIGPVHILPYDSFGTREHLHVRGRVLENKQIAPSTASDSPWLNMRATVKRFMSAEIPRTPVRISFQGQTTDLKTDAEGYFEATLSPTAPLPAYRLWHPVQIELTDPAYCQEEPVRATAQVLVPPLSASFGIISDVDDTVIKSYAYDFVRLLALTLFRNAHTRRPFEGVADFYHLLQKGHQRSSGLNPIFYVSSSPWNLYDLLVDTMEAHGIPKGPLMLRDLGIDEDKFIKSSHGRHKRHQIDRVLNTYPDLPFILIGDSGQHDPEIYADVVNAYPNRVLAVYIRDVTRGKAGARIEHLSSTFPSESVPMLLVKDTKQALEHAIQNRWVSPLLETTSPQDPSSLTNTFRGTPTYSTP